MKHNWPVSPRLWGKQHRSFFSSSLCHLAGHPGGGGSSGNSNNDGLGAIFGIICAPWLKTDAPGEKGWCFVKLLIRMVLVALLGCFGAFSPTAIALGSSAIVKVRGRIAFGLSLVLRDRSVLRCHKLPRKVPPRFHWGCFTKIPHLSLKWLLFQKRFFGGRCQLFFTFVSQSRSGVKVASAIHLHSAEVAVGVFVGFNSTYPRMCCKSFHPLACLLKSKQLVPAK